jgi:hypothetical protein
MDGKGETLVLDCMPREQVKPAKKGQSPIRQFNDVNDG